MFRLIIQQEPPFAIDDYRFGVVVQGHAHINFNLVEKPSRRKDRVMSLCYNLDIVKQKEDEYIALQNQETNSFLDYVAFV